MSDHKPDERGLWRACSNMEQAASGILNPLLSAFGPAVEACYEAGVLAPTLPALRHGEEDVRLAALFLKRALTDLRATWLLLQMGYTASAASVGAAAIENALTVSALAGSPDRAKELMAAQDGDVPWNPMKLAKLRADRWRSDGTVTKAADYEMAWREVYSAYKWLCKIKHPTLRSASHEAHGTHLPGSDYVVMAAPDVRDEDQPVKAVVLTTVTNHVKAAIIHFADALECIKADDAYASFCARIGGVEEALSVAYSATMTGDLPFTIRSDKVAREWADLKATSPS